MGPLEQSAEYFFLKTLIALVDYCHGKKIGILSFKLLLEKYKSYYLKSLLIFIIIFTMMEKIR